MVPISSGHAVDINTTSNTRTLKLLNLIKAADEFNLMSNMYQELRLENAIIKLTPMSFGNIAYNTNSSNACTVMEILATIESLDYGHTNSSPSPQNMLKDRTLKTLTPMFTMQGYNGTTGVMVPTSDVGSIRFTWNNDYKDDNRLFEAVSSDQLAQANIYLSN